MDYTASFTITEFIVSLIILFVLGFLIGLLLGVNIYLQRHNDGLETVLKDYRTILRHNFLGESTRLRQSENNSGDKL